MADQLTNAIETNDTRALYLALDEAGVSVAWQGNVADNTGCVEIDGYGRVMFTVAGWQVSGYTTGEREAIDNADLLNECTDLIAWANE